MFNILNMQKIYFYNFTTALNEGKACAAVLAGALPLPPPRAIQMHRPIILCAAGGWLCRAESMGTTGEHRASASRQAGRFHPRATGHRCYAGSRGAAGASYRLTARRHSDDLRRARCSRPGLHLLLCWAPPPLQHWARPGRRRRVVLPMGPADNCAMRIVTAWTWGDGADGPTPNPPAEPSFSSSQSQRHGWGLPFGDHHPSLLGFSLSTPSALCQFLVSQQAFAPERTEPFTAFFLIFFDQRVARRRHPAHAVRALVGLVDRSALVCLQLICYHNHMLRVASISVRVDRIMAELISACVVRRHGHIVR